MQYDTMRGDFCQRIDESAFKEYTISSNIYLQSLFMTKERYILMFYHFAWYFFLFACIGWCAEVGYAARSEEHTSELQSHAY